MTAPTAELDDVVGRASVLLVLAVVLTTVFADVVAEYFAAVVVTTIAILVLRVTLPLLGRYLE